MVFSYGIIPVSFRCVHPCFGGFKTFSLFPVLWNLIPRYLDVKSFLLVSVWHGPPSNFPRDQQSHFLCFFVCFVAFLQTSIGSFHHLYVFACVSNPHKSYFAYIFCLTFSFSDAFGGFFSPLLQRIISWEEGDLDSLIHSLVYRNLLSLVFG